MNGVVDGLNQTSWNLLLWIANGVLLGTLLAGLTWLLCRTLRKINAPALESVLWTLVLVKFLIPIGPQWRYSLPSLWNSIAAIGSAGELSRGVLQTTLAGWTPSTTNEVLLPFQDNAAAALGWWSWIVFLYLICVTILLWRRIRCHLRISRKYRALPEADRTVRELVESVCKRLGVRRLPAVRIGCEYPAPFVMGIFRPQLVLSHQLIAQPAELETVVVHEITHLRRGDPILHILQWVAGSFLFFWPVVAWVNRRIDASREQACDQWALRYGKLSAGAYARCVMQAIPSARIRCGAYRPVCMAGRISNFERRIDMILKSSKGYPRGPLSFIFALALVIAWGSFTLSGGSGVAKAIPADEQITKESVNKHAEKIVARISRYAVADVDQDGKISFEERNAFLVALFYTSPESAIEAFPYAGDFRGRKLELMEVYDVVRGLTYRKEVGMKSKQVYATAKEQGADEEKLKKVMAKFEYAEMAATDKVITAQGVLLDGLTAEPDAKIVSAIHQKLAKAYASDKVKKMSQMAIDMKKKIAALEAKGKTAEADELRSELKDVQAKLESMKKGKKVKKD